MPDSASTPRELGERDVIQAGQEYARENSIVLAQGGGEAVLIRPNYWRIRFALPEQGSGKLLELEFDELAQTTYSPEHVEQATGRQWVDAVPPTASASAPA